VNEHERIGGSGMAMTYCVSCDAEIHRENPKVGASITCTECGELLDVVDTDPFEVDYPPDDNWDDDEDDEDW
jgi:lysine biosynthesis protein LysW